MDERVRQFLDEDEREGAREVMDARNFTPDSLHHSWHEIEVGE